MLSILIGSLLTLTPSAHAEEVMSGTGVTATQTGSMMVPMETGALLQFKIDTLTQFLTLPLPQSRAAILLSATKQSGWESDVERYAEKSAEYRRTCREVMRKANRDTVMKQASTCMRGDLLLHLSFLRKQQLYVAALPALRAETRSGAILAITKLIDAEMTIVNALDTGLYVNIENLENTKGKLRDQYRAPYWLSLVRISADRQLTFIGLMLKRTSDILLSGNNTPLIEKSMLQALSCLTTSAEAYRSILTEPDLTVAEKTLSDTNKALPVCKNAVWTVAHLKSRQTSPSTGSGALQTEAKN